MPHSKDEWLAFIHEARCYRLQFYRVKLLLLRSCFFGRGLLKGVRDRRAKRERKRAAASESTARAAARAAVRAAARAAKSGENKDEDEDEADEDEREYLEEQRLAQRLRWCHPLLLCVVQPWLCVSPRWWEALVDSLEPPPGWWGDLRFYLCNNCKWPAVFFAHEDHPFPRWERGLDLFCVSRRFFVKQPCKSSSLSLLSFQ